MSVINNRLFCEERWHHERLAEEKEQPSPAVPAPALSPVDAVRAQASDLAATLHPLPGASSSRALRRRYRALTEAFGSVLRMIHAPAAALKESLEFRWLRDNVRVLTCALDAAAELPRLLGDAPSVRTSSGGQLPRVLVIAEDIFFALQGRFHEDLFTAYVDSFQETTVLSMQEVWFLVTALRFAFLEQIAVRAARLEADPQGDFGILSCVRSLREMGETDWEKIIEPLILFDRVLQEDPAGAYSGMDFESRDQYRKVVSKLAQSFPKSEMDVAIEALSLAHEAKQRECGDPRLLLRHSHIGYYMVAEGVEELQQRIGFRPHLGTRLLGLVRTRPTAFYLSAIALLTLALLALVLGLVSAAGISGASGWLLAVAALALLFPCSQSAVELVNFLVTCFVAPQGLPKLDFSEGVPADCVTLVAMPSLLLNEHQVRNLVSDMEVHYLGNRDPNIYFALLTDLPDCRHASSEDHPLLELCGQLVEQLNQKYADQGSGSFFLLHRHRVYNPRENAWMGWERKRGKLLDLNKLIRGEYDSFPVKVGDLPVLESVRFVITLDSDTELPRGTAQRLIGTLAHPLQQAIIDPVRNTVVGGYGILQPRVEVTVHSAARSRFTAIFSGQTGLDVYTRAVSDVYQDLFGEGIFTGKGIYEVDPFHRVLDRRLPDNTLLSHDLIEGVYARAGLASDIQLIDDYPSHYSSYCRRKHRWVRGDWQIAEWLLPRVPGPAGKRVPNPLSLISRWKILDNLRRSLVEPATFVLLVLGWLVLPGSAYLWTLATVAVLFMPACLSFGVQVVRALWRRKRNELVAATKGLLTAALNILLSLTFLLYQALLTLDAVVRTAVRRCFTRRRLLEWETAAEAESSLRGRTHLDGYLDWTPLFALALGALIALADRRALPPAIPLLLLWACSRPVSLFLSRPLQRSSHQISPADKLFLRNIALRTWRFFAVHSNEEHHWLVPDTVQKSPALVAARVSPTNAGLLLNARQVACGFGYLTVPEFAALSLRTLQTILKLPRYRGHLFNWYSTHDLRPLSPLFVSSVDSGNLVASLWTLQQGSLEQLSRPVISPAMAEGLLDCLHAALITKAGSAAVSALEQGFSGENWLDAILTFPEEELWKLLQSEGEQSSEAAWFAQEAERRLAEIHRIVCEYAPWRLPQFARLRQLADLGLESGEMPALAELSHFVQVLIARLNSGLAGSSITGSEKFLCHQLLPLLLKTQQHAASLIADLQTVAGKAGKLAGEMDFEFLLNRRRRLLSIGFDAESRRLHPSCYDLLASESRMAAFVAIAKEDIPQETWFFLGRSHTLHRGQPVLLSWSGSMFEYFMPALWMRSYRNTLLDRSLSTAVRAQRDYAASMGIPWGISESAYFSVDENNNYQYAPQGVPGLALHHDEREMLVVAPYSTVLSLRTDSARALENLRHMASLGWLAECGFYEAVDFSAARHARRKRGEIVSCWMAHHQGMALLALANCLQQGIVQRWFHSHCNVQATERLLHERPIARSLPKQRGTAAA